MLAAAGADVVQIDKATPECVARLSAAFRTHLPRPLLAAAGGINETNAAAFAAAGADLLVTSAPYYAMPRDVKLRMSRAG
jgi:molybdenum transport protein